MVEILDLITKASSIAIYTHINPDGDCNGSAFGLRQLIWDNLGKNKQIKVVGKDNPANLHCLGSYDQMTDDYAAVSLSIVVDTATAARVSDQRFKTGKGIIKIDHHFDSPDYGDVNRVELLTSCAELVAKIALELGWKFTKKSALPLLGGMVTDTGRFRFLKNASDTFGVAQHLLKTGVDLPVQLYEPLYMREREDLQFQAWYLKNIKFSNKCAYVVIGPKIVRRFGLRLGEASEWLINLRDLRGVLLWAQFVKYPDHWRCEYRSSKYFVNDLARKFGGGGHKHAAGSQVKDLKRVREIISQMEAVNE